MPSLESDTGKPVDVTPPDEAAAIKAQFSAAMNDDGPDEKQTPKRQPRQPADPDKAKSRATAKAEKSRTADKPPAVVKDDYTADAQGLVGAAWTVAASIPYTQPYALILESNADALVGALAEGAKNSATIRSFVDSGKSSWMLTLAGVGLNMGMQAYQMARDPELQERARAVTVEHLKAAIGAKGIEVPVPTEA